MKIVGSERVNFSSAKNSSILNAKNDQGYSPFMLDLKNGKLSEMILSYIFEHTFQIDKGYFIPNENWGPALLFCMTLEYNGKKKYENLFK